MMTESSLWRYFSFVEFSDTEKRIFQIAMFETGVLSRKETDHLRISLSHNRYFFDKGCLDRSQREEERERERREFWRDIYV